MKRPDKTRSSGIWFISPIWVARRFLSLFKCRKCNREMAELLRHLKRCLDGYVSLRRAFLFIIIFLGLLLYISPSLFRWIRKKTPMMMDSNIRCVSQQLSPFLEFVNSYDASINKSYETVEKPYLPYTGNGYLGLPLDDPDNPVYVLHKRALTFPLSYHPFVNIHVDGGSSQHATVTHFTAGIVQKFQCFNVKRKSVIVSHSVYAHRTIPSLIMQNIKIVNQMEESLTVQLHRRGWSGDQELKSQAISVQSLDELSYVLLYGKINAPDSTAKHSIISLAIATAHVPNLVTVEGKSSKTLVIPTIIHYSNPTSADQYEAWVDKMKVAAREDLRQTLETKPYMLKNNHVQVWKQLWNTGLGISESKAQGALNGDIINATIYYVLSQTRSYLSEVETTPNKKLNLEALLTYPDRCYDGHPTLQASTLWSDLTTVSQVNQVASLWLLTLDKQGCHNLLRAGSEGVIQAMVLSFGAFRFSNHHLEFCTHPRELHRDYYFRRLSYGNATHVNVTVIVGEDNRAVLYAALDRSDKDYYACDGGCLDAPVKLGSKPIQFPVKLTEPVTAILYITADKQHMEELKHTIHVKEVAEAPAHEHHIIALHRHGHQLGGLPALFWVSIAFLIVVFHLFLAKLIYNEYCSSGQEKSRGRYVV